MGEPTHLYIEVKGESGIVENRAVECNPPELLNRAGWKPLTKGTTISILVYPPLSRMALLNKIRTPGAAREHLQSNRYIAGGCATTTSMRKQLGYGPPCR
jgi:hypothetical protein